ncbi:MAG: flagellar brake protein [Firmicutes bacterium]|nr:flagellar brake protein [Bacillota bacterium]
MSSEPVPVDVNDLVEIEVPEGPAKGRYRSRVEFIDEQGHLSLAAPVREGARVRVSDGTPVLVHVRKADPARGAHYVGHTTVVGRTDEGRVPVVVVARPPWERVQLREWTRATAMVPVRYRPLRTPGQRPARWIAAESRALGGGGLMLRTRQPIETGGLLEVVIELPQRRVGAVAEVVRVQPGGESDAEAGSSWSVALKFLQIAEADRDRLIGFVLRRQAEMRRMGLI